MSAEETRVLADKLAILEVIATYSYTWDGKDPDGFANLFTVDGMLELYPEGDSVNPFVHEVSRDGIRSWAASWVARALVEEANVRRRHYQTGTVFLELTPDTARTRTMLLVARWEREDGIPHAVVSGTGIYLDEWRRTETSWQFARRRGWLD